MPTLLHGLLTDSAARFPDKVCLEDGDSGVTFSELTEQVCLTTRLLLRAAIEPGDRVAVHLEKSIEEVVAVLAISMAGGVSVNINTLLKGRQVRHILEDSGARALVTSYPRLKNLGAGLAGIATLRTLIACGKMAAVNGADIKGLDLVDMASAAALGPFGAPARRIDSDIAAIIYTSGSTGLPKGVILSHRNLVAGAESVACYLRNTPEDRILSILPFSFDYGLNQLTTSLLTGATLVLRNYLSAGQILASLEADRITGLAGVPTIWSQLLQADWSGRRFPDLRYITNSGGRFSEEHVREYRRRLPDTDIYLMYGLTEAFRSTYLEPEQVDVRPASIGKAIPNAEILVLNDEGRPCGPGEVGELVHRGAHVALGYWKDPELTDRRFRPNPLQPAGVPGDERVVFSGDLVRKDEEGYLYFVGRRDHMIKTSGFRVSPTEVEEYFYNTGLVQDAVAYGVPDPDLGEHIRVVLSLRPGAALGAAELLAMVSRQMPGFMVPREIDVLEALPRTSSGKLDRKLVSSVSA